MADLMQIKQEPDIKSEPEDEVDTIEYEQPLNETFSVKVEKIDPDDEVNAPSAYINRFGKLVDNEQPCSSHMGIHPNGTSDATTSHEQIVFDATKAITGAKPIGKSKKIIGRTNNKRSASFTRKKQHKCKYCGYVALFPSGLELHTRTHTGERPFPCNSCGKRFIQKQHLQRHMKVHIIKDSIHCSGCLKIFASKEEELNHRSVCKRRRYECFLCQAYSTPLITNLKRHMRMHNGERPFQCAQCSMRFTRKDRLNNHMKTHTRPQKPRCSVCARNFSKLSERDTHEMNCSRRRYECYLCQSYMTNYRRDLQSHLRIKHTCERPFKCGSCVRCYATKNQFQHHIKKIHKE